MSNADTMGGEARQSGMTLRDYIRVARSYWKGILSFVLVAVLVGFVWASIQPKIYASDSSGIIVTGGADNLSLSLAGDNLAKSKARNYQTVASSRLVAERVVKDLGLDNSPESLLGSIAVTVPVDTAEIRISATSQVPAEAQRIGDAWVRALAAQVSELETLSTSESAVPVATAAVRLVPLGQAVLPVEPVSPNMKIALAFAGLAGLVLGLGYALLRNHLDRRLRSVSDIERLVGVPVIGTLPVDHRLDSGSAVVDVTGQGRVGKSSQSHAISEALRELRTNLQFIDVDNPPKIIVVTSSVPSEGKSTVTANLAVTMAAAGENVVVIDGDLRRPTVVKVFQLVPGVGVTDVLSGNAEISDVLQQWGALPNLHVLGSGRIPPNPSELLGSKAMRTLLQTLAQSATVLIDAPPLLPVTDAVVLSKIADGAIVVVRSGKTTQEELTRAVTNLAKAKSHVLGAILNCVPLTGSDAYSYYGAYQSVQDEPEPDISVPSSAASAESWSSTIDSDELRPERTFSSALRRQPPR